MDHRTVRVIFEDDGSVTFENVTLRELQFLVAHLPFIARELADNEKPGKPVTEE